MLIINEKQLTTELIKDGICPIGAGDSVLNTTAYIVDPDTRKAVPKGSVGAIYIGGEKLKMIALDYVEVMERLGWSRLVVLDSDPL